LTQNDKKAYRDITEFSVAIALPLIFFMALLPVFNPTAPPGKPYLVYTAEQIVSYNDADDWYGMVSVFDANGNPIPDIWVSGRWSVTSVDGPWFTYSNSFKDWRTDDNGTLPSYKWAPTDDSEQALWCSYLFFVDYEGPFWTNVSVPSLGLWQIHYTQIYFDYVPP
jgi:hypothetical protein